ncbi:MAG: hypothetical protein ABR577_13750 [Pyrinomonadaceae bacterium]
MNTVVVANNFRSALAVVPTGAIMHSPPAKDARIPLLKISSDDFNFEFSSSISHIAFAGTFNGYVIEAPVYEDVNVVINLIGRLVEQDKFQVEEVSMRVEFQPESARPDFIASTILAIISLADDVRLCIPEVDLDLSLKFQSSLLDINLMLQRRQLAYRFMVVERATGYKFELPPEVSGTEVENLAFIYYAIVERSFVFPFTTMTYPSIPATESHLEQITALGRKSSIRVGPEPLYKTLLGKTIQLGNESTWIIENAVIENFDQVQKELASGDGHSVEVTIRSLSGRARYNLPTAPLLPRNPWSAQLQKLIDLESDLDARLAGRYHALAASTLANLSSEERVAITTRPELDVNIFLSK